MPSEFLITYAISTDPLRARKENSRTCETGRPLGDRARLQARCKSIQTSTSTAFPVRGRSTL